MTRKKDETDKGYVPSCLCQFEGLSCMGCCGHDFGTKEEIEEGLAKNTLEWKQYDTSTLEGKRKFMERSTIEDLRQCGICRNLIIFDDWSIGCPLHPSLNGGIDIRDGHCDIKHLCKAAYEFPTWDRKKQEDFREFIRSKDLDWHSYSIGMDTGKLLGAFKRKRKER